MALNKENNEHTGQESDQDQAVDSGSIDQIKKIYCRQRKTK